MLKIAALACVACLACFACADEYVAKNVRPSRLLGAAVGVRPGADRFGGTATVFRANGGASLIPDGVSVQANDETSKLTIDGPKSKIQELVRVFQLLDVRPRTVRITMDISCAADKYASHSSFEVPNNATHGTDDGVVGVKVSIAPRINDDGTITAFISVDHDKSAIHMIARSKTDAEQTMSVLGKEISYGLEKTSKNPSAERILIRFKMSVVDKR